MTHVAGEFNFIRSCSHFGAFLQENEHECGGTVYCEFHYLSKGKVTCYQKILKFSLLKNDNHSLTLKVQDACVIWTF